MLLAGYCLHDRLLSALRDFSFSRLMIWFEIDWFGVLYCFSQVVCLKFREMFWLVFAYKGEQNTSVDLQNNHKSHAVLLL